MQAYGRRSSPPDSISGQALLLFFCEFSRAPLRAARHGFGISVDVVGKRPKQRCLALSAAHHSGFIRGSALEFATAGTQRSLCVHQDHHLQVIFAKYHLKVFTLNYHFMLVFIQGKGNGLRIEFPRAAQPAPEILAQDGRHEPSPARPTAWSDAVACLSH
ncbi:hypothetical protein N0K08_08540 [Acidovorax sp. Be4]|uniref:Uncharacterized protein n=1 Tax=Acidovorax bellezanensis TaxID=2976702 RepID=A0ABT2PLF6_9BURK|nr:hypothetical protein [Acidovorax sp. Be4]MCT9810679.1 hypothetical protein [Acidovorax sp. Be4]